MSTVQTSNVTLPSSPEDRKAIKSAIVEASDSLVRIDAEKDLIKDIKQGLKDKFDIPPKLASKLISIYHKQNYGEVAAEQEALEEAYETLLAAKDA